MTSYGRVHKLIVREIGEPDESEFEDYEIVHTAECETQHGDGWDEYVCGVAWNAENCGVKFALDYSHDDSPAIKAPGEYEIQAWSETIYGFDYTEYDGGLCLVEPNNASDDASREMETAIDSELR